MQVYKLKPRNVVYSLRQLVWNRITDLNRANEPVMLDPTDINSSYYSYVEVENFIEQLHGETLNVLEPSDSEYPQYFAVPKNMAILQLDGFGSWFGGIDKHILDLVAYRVSLHELGNVDYSQMWLNYDDKDTTESGCKHPNKYLNRLSANLSFMVCPDCKKEVN